MRYGGFKYPKPYLDGLGPTTSINGEGELLKPLLSSSSTSKPLVLLSHNP